MVKFTKKKKKKKKKKKRDFFFFFDLRNIMRESYIKTNKKKKLF